MKKKRKDGLKRQSDIMKLSLEMFSDRGYHAVSVDDIISAAGIAKGTFYLHFSGKLEILEMIIDKYLTILYESVKVLDISMDKSIEDIKKIYLDVTKILLKEKGFGQFLKIVLRDISSINHELYGKINTFYVKLVMMSAEFHINAQKKGKIKKELDPVIASYCIFGAVKDLVFRLVVLEEKIDIMQSISTMFDLFLGGMLVEKST
ncbi:MAG: TetR/AcrR family transcriptional regulator [Proteobacteria bacterium]|nr:TetR/AcrR family transcriptional regulator [Pseudomonadota bacterium]